MGILVDPQTQGLLAAAFAALQGSGPSRTPTTFGQVLGQAGQAGMETAQGAQRAQTDLALKDIALKKAQADLEAQQQLGGLFGATNDPDKMEAIGLKMSLAGHPGGAALVEQARKLRAQKSAEAQLATLKSAPGVTPDPQEVQQAEDQGTPAPVSKPSNPGIFGSLTESEIPQIAAQAKAAQAAVDAQPNAMTVSPQHWVDLQGKLASQEATLLSRKENLPKSEHIIQDKASPTGWSYEDTRTLKRTPGAPPPPSAAIGIEAVPAKDKVLHGKDYLATLPSGMQEVVKGIAEGRIDPTKASSMRYGNREALMQRVMQYDPSYNQGRVKVWSDFTSGKTAQNITAMNTAIAHMGTVDELTDALKNGNVQQVNRLVNEIRTQTGKPEVNNANIAIQAMGNELMRVFRQVGASEHETQDWQRRFDAAKGSPSQLKGALQVGAELLKGRLDAVNDQWKRGMNSEEGFPNILSPKSAAVMQRLTIGASRATDQQLQDLVKQYAKPR